MKQNTEQNTTNTEEISNSQDTNNTDIEPETEEVLAEIVDTLEKPELKPKRERSAAQKRAFEKARLCLADKRRIAREQKALEPKKPRGRPVKKTTLPAQELIENTEMVYEMLADARTRKTNEEIQYSFSTKRRIEIHPCGIVVNSKSVSK